MNCANKVSKQLIEITKDFLPGDLKKERRYQTLLAAQTASFKSILPKDLQDKEAVETELTRLAQSLFIA